ncbi:hypothetical protein D3C75_581700 [compost metagenome]
MQELGHLGRDVPILDTLLIGVHIRRELPNTDQRCIGANPLILFRICDYTNPEAPVIGIHNRIGTGDRFADGHEHFVNHFIQVRHTLKPDIRPVNVLPALLNDHLLRTVDLYRTDRRIIQNALQHPKLRDFLLYPFHHFIQGNR